MEWRHTEQDSSFSKSSEASFGATAIFLFLICYLVPKRAAYRKVS